MMFNSLAGDDTRAAVCTVRALRVRMIACCVVAMLTMEAQGQEVMDPEGMVRSAVESVFEAIGEGPDQLHRAIESSVGPCLDARTTAQVALGTFWRDANADQRRRVALGVRRLVLNGLASALEREPRARVEVLATRPGASADDATVQTRVHVSSGPPIAINYRLQRGTDAWWLYDISIEGVSMLTTYRRSFATRVRRVGMEAFIAELESR